MFGLCSHLALFALIAALTGIQNDLFKLIAFEKIGHFARIQNVVDILEELLLHDLAVDQQECYRLVFNLKKNIFYIFNTICSRSVRVLAPYPCDAIKYAQIFVERIQIVVSPHLDLPAIVFIDVRCQSCQ